MQKYLAIGRGAEILDQKKPGGGAAQRTPPPASLRVNINNQDICSCFITIVVLSHIYCSYNFV